MAYSIGQEVKLNGEVYTIVGTVKRSWLLEKDGQQFKATSAHMDKIVAQNQAGIGNEGGRRKRRPKTDYIDQRLRFDRIFNKDAKRPETEEELLKWLERLVGELSPENLCCDGELSHAQVAAKLRDIKAEWRQVEGLLGYRISEEKIEDRAYARFRRSN
jgi:hypothetical protein